MTSLIRRVLCIHLPVLNKQGLEGLYLTHILKNGSHSHTWNYEDQAFEYQVDQLGVENLFPNENEAITRELIMYIEEWEKTHIKNKSQVSKYMFLAKYGILALYD